MLMALALGLPNREVVYRTPKLTFCGGRWPCNSVRGNPDTGLLRSTFRLGRQPGLSHREVLIRDS
jgi:hypothetical protein